jgi:leader peptidase (prepilin peptidase)/N-methyltransferase
LSFAAGTLLAAMLIAISIVDLRSRRIPNILSLPLAAAGLGWTAWATPEALPSHVIGALIGYAVLAAFGEVYFRKRGREGLGLGDAKLFAAGGAWLGWQNLPLVMLIASVTGLLYALVTRRLRADDEFAFGPWIALGIWIAWIAIR